MAQRFDKKQNVTKKNNAFTALHNLYSDREISNMMNRFGYNDDIMLVMNGNQERLKERFPQTWNNISSCTRKADSRTPMQYAKDIVSAWVIEDLVREKIQEQGLKVSLNGGDKNRQFLSQEDVTPDSDFEVEYKGVTRKVELSNDYSGFVVKNHFNDLRGHKLRSLKKEESILLVVNIEKGLFGLVDSKKPIKEQEIYNKAYGKVCHRVFIDKFFSLGKELGPKLAEAL